MFYKKINDVRTSKSIYLNDASEKELLNLNNLVSSITNLSITTADGWQVANYGIGGHLEPHFDFMVININ